MITDSDVKKLKISFATKKDIRDLDDRIRFMNKDMTEAFKTILEMIGDLIERIDKHDRKFDEQGKRIEQQVRRIDEQGKRQDAILEELRSNRIVLGNHEKRIQKVEYKVFPQT